MVLVAKLNLLFVNVIIPYHTADDITVVPLTSTYNYFHCLGAYHVPNLIIITSIKIEGWRDGSAKKHTFKIYRDNLSHPLYIPTLAFLDNIMHASVDQCWPRWQMWGIPCYRVSLIQYVKCCYALIFCTFRMWEKSMYWLSDCSCMHPIATQKASVRMYSGCDKLSLQICSYTFWYCHPYSILFFGICNCRFLLPSG